MGIYYLAANHTKKEYIDPNHITGGGRKMGEIVQNDFAHVLCYLMANGSLWGSRSGWNDYKHQEVEVIPDSTAEYDRVRETYKDISKEAYEDYKELVSL